MGVSLEARVPILDHRVVEFAWRLPMELKFNSAGSKWALRQVLYRYVPPALVERPKMGFAVPIDRWLRGPLRDWAESLLDPSRLRREGFFDQAQVRHRWNEYLSGRRKWHNRLWALLMFQSWLDTQRGHRQSSLAVAARP
jgi:asparagine synthase (glutamine-hydrolysing)